MKLKWLRLSATLDIIICEKIIIAKSKDYYNRMITLNPGNKDNKIKGYNGIGQLERGWPEMKKQMKAGFLTLQNQLMHINKILALDPNNAFSKKSG